MDELVGDGGHLWGGEEERAGGEALMRGNQISMNAGAGVFAHADSTATLTANVFRGNKGMELAARPLSRMSVADTDLRCIEVRAFRAALLLGGWAIS